jgi:hypothetical protein
MRQSHKVQVRKPALARALILVSSVNAKVILRCEPSEQRTALAKSPFPRGGAKIPRQTADIGREAQAIGTKQAAHWDQLYCAKQAALLAKMQKCHHETRDPARHGPISHHAMTK